jgi:hypothetical protein
MTIWDDPWIAVATARGDTGTPWCTTLPPPPPAPDTGRFECRRWAEVPAEAWIERVGTRWSPAELELRLTDAWIPLLYDESGALVATCVLRPRGGVENVWLLETLRAVPRWGSRLMRHLMTWIWLADSRGGGNPFILGFTWELTVAQLAVAWWRGWLAAATTVEMGWMFRAEGCSFCPSKNKETWQPLHPRFAEPALFQQGHAWAIVNDSGLGDGWGHVVAWRGDLDWSAVAERGRWRSLWVRSVDAPSPKWWPTGEFVVVGLLNSADGRPAQIPWITAEI